MKRSAGARALAAIRQLACLGLPPALAIPKLLGALHDWVPADSNHFTWSDETGLPTNYYGELTGIERYMLRFFTEFAHEPDPPFTPPYPQIVRSGDALTIGVDNGAAFVRSLFYAEFFRPLDGRYVLCASVRAAGRPYGLITLLRGAGGAPFDSDDLAAMRAAAPWFVHALSAPDPGESGPELPLRLDTQALVVLDDSGRIVHLERDARRLLHLATHPSTDGRSLAQLGADGMSRRITRLCRDLVRTFRGEAAGPPGFALSNPWGRFVIRGHRLEDTGGGRPAIGLTISHYVPRRLRLWQSLRPLGLSPRLQEAALHFADGCSLTELARRMNIRRNTAITYVEAVYDRLGVQPSRESLQEFLLADGGLPDGATGTPGAGR